MVDFGLFILIKNKIGGVSMKNVKVEKIEEGVYRGHRAMLDVFQVISSIVIYGSWGYVEILNFLA